MQRSCHPLRFPVWLWPNICCLDAPTVALVWQEAVARHWNVSLNPPERAALFLTVWAVYLADRALESGPATTPRHAVARKHRATFLSTATLAGVGAAVLAGWQLPAVILHTGAPVAFLAGLYFVWNHMTKHRGNEAGARAVFVGLVFASGVALAPFAILLNPPADSIWVLLLCAGLFVSNCLEAAKQEARQTGAPGPKFGGLPLACAAALAAGCLLFADPADAMLYVWITVSAATLAAVCAAAKRLGPNATTAAIDAALLWPLAGFLGSL